MKKFKKYTFYIGFVGEILGIICMALEFFGFFDIVPILTEVVIIISTILVAIGVVEKEDKDLSSIPHDIKASRQQSTSKTDKNQTAKTGEEKTEVNEEIKTSVTLPKLTKEQQKALEASSKILSINKKD